MQARIFAVQVIDLLSSSILFRNKRGLNNKEGHRVLSSQLFQAKSREQLTFDLSEHFFDKALSQFSQFFKVKFLSD